MVFRCPAKFYRQASYVSYTLLSVVVFYLIANTGQLQSGFIPIWTSLMFIGSAFHSLAAILGIIISLLYIAFLWVENTLIINNIIYVIVMGVVPAIIGWILWGRNKDMFAVGEANNPYHRLAAELSQVAGKSEVVINTIDDGVLALDHAGTIELINPAAQRMIGWGKQDALGLNYASVLKLVDANNNALSPLQHPIQQVLQSNMQIVSDEYRVFTSSEKTLQIALVVSPISQQNTGVIVVFRDITAAKQEERAQAEFISTASHEMRTPVAAIEGYLGLALNPATATIDAKAREFIQKAQSSASHLGRLFQDLLDVSKADDRRLVQKPSLIDATEFVGEISQGFVQMANEKQLTFNFPTSDASSEKFGSILGSRRISPIYYLYIDRDHLREVIANLIENAIKYTPRGSVTVAIEGDDKKILITIADTGIGIPSEDIPHLFQKFYRIDNSDTREIGGTGLGLYLCRRLTEEMGGRIWAKSVYSQGSTFYLEFPRIDHAAAEKLREQQNSVAVTQPSQFTVPVAPPQVSTAPPTPAIPPTPTTAPPTAATPAPTPPTAPAPQPTPPAAQPSTPVSAPTLAPIAAPPTPTVSSPPGNPTRIPVTSPPPTTPPPPIPTVVPRPTPPAPSDHRPASANSVTQILPVDPRFIPTPTTDRTNTPLGELERNSAHYIQPRPEPLAVPPRQS